MEDDDVNKNIFNLFTLLLIADTGAMLSIGVRKLGCENIVPRMVLQLLCILPKANFPLNASVNCLPSFLIVVSQKRLIIDVASSNNIHD